MKNRLTRRTGWLLLLVMISLGGAGCFTTFNTLTTLRSSRMTIHQLRQRLGDPDLVVIDVRGASQWSVTKVKIPGAVWESPGKYRSWIPNYPVGKTIVLYCD